MARRRPHPHLVTRAPHRALSRRRAHPVTAVALLGVLGPGLLAGLSDDDPAGITTYSVIGARYGYELLWVLVVSTIALIVFHELAARLGVVTGKGLMRLMRERYGRSTVNLALLALVAANLGTLTAEFAGVAAGGEVLGAASRYVSVPLVALLVGALVLRGSYRRVEHVLLALGAVFVAYIVSGLMAHPDWEATARGTLVPEIPAGRDAVLAVVATVGTTLAPWGLVFIQSYVVDKGLHISELRFERIDVVTGALMTGVIGMFVVVACAATLHAGGQEIDSARDAAVALEPFAGKAATALFGVGLIGAAVLAAAVVPMSTAYSVAEAYAQPADLNLGFGEARLFYIVFGASIGVTSVLVLIPGAPLIEILYLTQALNAILLLGILPFIYGLARDDEIMGERRVRGAGAVLAGGVIALVGASVVALLAFQIA